jgi:Fe-S cluster assembly scaffold protein SufB
MTTQLIFTQGSQARQEVSVAIPESNEIILSSLFPSELKNAEELAVQIRVSHSAPVTIIDDIVVAGKLFVSIAALKDQKVTYQWKHLSSEYQKIERYLSVIAAHPGSSVHATCICKTVGSEQISLHTEQAHTSSHTQSEVVIRGVSEDTSRVTVKSEVCIFEGIAGVQAHQIHKHLLLDQGARAVSEPILEVLSDDVKCSHGSAIRYLDSYQLFYLQSRGYTPEAAREALVTAFLTV